MSRVRSTPSANLFTGHLDAFLYYMRSLILVSISFAFITIACSSGPQPIPYAATKLLAASHPALNTLEENISKKKAEQDALEAKAIELNQQKEKAKDDQKIKDAISKNEKERALCESELSLLIAEHQLEAARLLKKDDIAAYEKTVSKRKEAVEENRKRLQAG